MLDLGRVSTNTVEFMAEHIQAEVEVNVGLANTKVQMYEMFGMASRNLIVHLQSKLYGTPLDTFTVKYPLDWVQAFKERWFPAWLLNRYPVKYASQSVSRRIVLPNWAVDSTRGKVYIQVTSGPNFGLYAPEVFNGT